MEGNKKKIIIALAAVWGFILVIGLGVVIFRIGKVAVTVKYAPFAATVKLNDTTVGNNGVNYITPGDYHVVVEYENFTTLEQDVTIDEDTKYLYGGLDPVNEAGEVYMREHLEDYYEMQGIAGEMAIAQGTAQREEFPLIAKLPVKDPYYNIGYNFDEDGGGMNVTVEAGIAYRQLAVSRLLELMDDEDFGKYNVIFYDLDNPYEGKFVDNGATDPVDYLKKGFDGSGLNFEVGGGVRDGDYYYAYLRYYYRTYVGVIYRVVLKEVGGKWQLMTTPYPILTTSNSPDVPLNIINAVNSL